MGLLQAKQNKLNHVNCLREIGSILPCNDAILYVFWQHALIICLPSFIFRCVVAYLCFSVLRFLGLMQNICSKNGGRKQYWTVFLTATWRVHIQFLSNFCVIERKKKQKQIKLVFHKNSFGDLSSLRFSRTPKCVKVLRDRNLSILW